MEELIYYSRLFDIYGKVLTEKQIEVFEYYFFENLTIEEIAKSKNVSKNAISKSILNIKKILDSSEEKMHIYEYMEKLKSEFKDDKDILIRIEKYDNIILGN